MLKYFGKCETLEELKKEYRKLAMRWHPDVNGGDTEKMQEINGEYDRVFPTLKNKHKNHKGEAYTKETEEAPEEFRNIIDALMKMAGVEVEVIGCFIWVNGNTKPYKEELKKMGFKWHSKKKCWYKSPEGYRRRGKKRYDMDEIRSMYGVQYECTGAGMTELTA